MSYENNKELEILSKETLTDKDVYLIDDYISKYIHSIDYSEASFMYARVKLKRKLIERIDNTLKQLNFYREYYERLSGEYKEEKARD